MEKYRQRDPHSHDIHHIRGHADKYEITIVWKGMKADTTALQKVYAKGSMYHSFSQCFIYNKCMIRNRY
jgi:hypothetical protein